MCVYIYIYGHPDFFVTLCIYIYTYIYIYTHTHVCMNLNTYIYIYIYIYTHAHTPDCCHNHCSCRVLGIWPCKADSGLNPGASAEEPTGDLRGVCVGSTSFQLFSRDLHFGPRHEFEGNDL